MGAIDAVEDRLDCRGRGRDFFGDGGAARHAEGVEVGGAGGREVVVAGTPFFASRFRVAKLESRPTRTGRWVRGSAQSWA